MKKLNILSTIKERESKNILFVTAHPDDELLFFFPLINSLKNNKKKIFLLCLSTGDYEERKLLNKLIEDQEDNDQNVKLFYQEKNNQSYLSSINNKYEDENMNLLDKENEKDNSYQNLEENSVNDKISKDLINIFEYENFLFQKNFIFNNLRKKELLDCNKVLLFDYIEIIDDLQVLESSKTARYYASECLYNIHRDFITSLPPSSTTNTNQDILYYYKNYYNKLDNFLLRDNPNNKWNKDIIAEVVLKYIDKCMKEYKLPIDEIITFDNYGISGHINHISTHYGVVETMKRYERLIISPSTSLTSLSQSSNLLTNIKGYKPIICYQLKSIHLIRKYLSIFNIIITIFIYIFYLSLYKFSLILNISTNIFINNNTYYYYSLNLNKSFQGLYYHKSQALWYRNLFLIFSSYTFFNIITPLIYNEDNK